MNREKAVAGASQASKLLPLSAEQTEALQKMHAVFDERSPSGKPWYKLQVNVLGESNETEAKTYLAGVALVKDAKHLYLGDLHGSWLKGLLQLAQMEAIVMHEDTAKEFLAIHQAFKSVEIADVNRITEDMSAILNQKHWQNLQVECIDKVNSL